jgi:hypothetical protein
MVIRHRDAVVVQPRRRIIPRIPVLITLIVILLLLGAINVLIPMARKRRIILISAVGLVVASWLLFAVGIIPTAGAG